VCVSVSTNVSVNVSFVTTIVPSVSMLQSGDGTSWFERRNGVFEGLAYIQIKLALLTAQYWCIDLKSTHFLAVADVFITYIAIEYIAIYIKLPCLKR
ncbi:MAG: hypothetical protein ABIO88_07545, partial [Burkholderiaceae bacterium]